MKLTLSGRVERGEGMATRLGCPTANIAIEQGVLIPALGVYLGEAEVDGVWHDALICISDGRTGYNLKMEIHLLGVNRDLNGKHIEVVLYEKLRDVIPFPGEKEMATIIADDLVRARVWADARKIQVEP
ncbi:MAG: riboflavin kinase [Candidatus Uhrbacteria bacterium]|nr:riboflavin kinase [Candidatus Uhrbacteria bacterium]